MNDKARIIFVDDEKRVLNSMRGLFRREFELFLTTDGSDAVRIASENTIDVIVADQRMPGMSGIEVLGKVKELSPRTVRILLTGYADPDAVEGSINIGEVFRFLSKPCPPQMLRDTLKLAVAASQSEPLAQVPKPPVVETPATAQAVTRPRPATPSLTAGSPQRPDVRVLRQELLGVARPLTPLPRPQAAPISPPLATPSDIDASSSHWQTVTNVVLSGDTCEEFPAPDFGSHTKTEIKNVGIVFFTVDPGFVETAMRAAAGDRSVTLATTLAKVAETIERKEAGVLVTDFTTNNTKMQKIISILKQFCPELVTIIASKSRDTTDMISLINYGQVFRYVLKPIEPKILMYEINAAAAKHLDLLGNPGSAIRHQVVSMGEPDDATGTLNNFASKIRELRAGQTGSRK